MVYVIGATLIFSSFSLLSMNPQKMNNRPRDWFEKEGHGFHFPAINAFIQEHSHINITEKLINESEKKNGKFYDAIIYFTQIASNNHRNVTPHTLVLVENPEAQQPTRMLNKLPLPIKKYVMKCAEKNMDPYIINIGIEEKPIQFATICEHADLAATYHSTFITMWNLTTSKMVHTLLENDVFDMVFNNTGTQLAYGFKNNQQKIVKIFDTEEKKLLHTISVPKIKNLFYSVNPQNMQSFLLSAFTKFRGMHSWLITTKKYIYLGFLPNGTNIDLSLNSFGKYSIKNNPQCSILSIEKQSPSFYLCQKAGNRAWKQKDVKKIISSRSYKSLTENEEDTINQELAKKDTSRIIVV